MGDGADGNEVAPRAVGVRLSAPDCVKVLDQDGLVLSFNEDGLRLMELDSLSAVQGCYWPML